MESLSHSAHDCAYQLVLRYCVSYSAADSERALAAAISAVPQLSPLAVGEPYTCNTGGSVVATIDSERSPRIGAIFATGLTYGTELADRADTLAAAFNNQSLNAAKTLHNQQVQLLGAAHAAIVAAGITADIGWLAHVCVWRAAANAPPSTAYVPNLVIRTKMPAGSAGGGTIRVRSQAPRPNTRAATMPARAPSSITRDVADAAQHQQ